METCKTCTHWYTGNQSQLHRAHRESGRGICLKSTMVEGQTGITYGNDEPGPAIAVGISIGSFPPQMVLGQLETTPDFGCNQYEAQ